MAVSEALLRAFNANIGELSKPALEQFIRCCQRVLHRGHNVGSGGQKQQVPRIVLSGDVLTELLYGAYYCIYNGLQLPGSQVRMDLSNIYSDYDWLKPICSFLLRWLSSSGRGRPRRGARRSS